jgi:beta-glucosidase
VLAGFSKLLDVPAGQSVDVHLPISQRWLSVWDTSLHAYTPVKGDFTAFVGASSEDIRLTATFTNA